MADGRLCALLLLAGGATAIAASNCFVQGYEVTAPTPPEDAGPDASGGGSSCGHATWPSPPDAGDSGGQDLDLVMAVRSIDFKEADADGDTGPTVGYDLDSHCTCQGEGPNCTAPDWATAEHCDGPQGRDNAWVYIFRAAGSFGAEINSASYSQMVAAGDFTALVRIRNYNGQPNDDQVHVALYPSGGLKNDPCGPADHTAKWDGTDRWPVIYSALAGSGGGDAGFPPTGGAGGCGGSASIPPGLSLDNPKYQDVNGYVTDSVFVASIPELAIMLSGDVNASQFKLKAAFVTGRLVQVAPDNHWAIREGLLAGRLEVNEVFRTLSTLVITMGQVCTDNPVYGWVKTAVCHYPDLSSTLGGPTTPCDAISFGMLVEADPAQLGIVYVPAGTPGSCDAGNDPANDSCGS
jgi:hypothetical protein